MPLKDSNKKERRRAIRQLGKQLVRIVVPSSQTHSTIAEIRRVAKLKWLATVLFMMMIAIAQYEAGTRIGVSSERMGAKLVSLFGLWVIDPFTGLVESFLWVRKEAKSIQGDSEADANLPVCVHWKKVRKSRENLSGMKYVNGCIFAETQPVLNGQFFTEVQIVEGKLDEQAPAVLTNDESVKYCRTLYGDWARLPMQEELIRILSYGVAKSVLTGKSFIPVNPAKGYREHTGDFRPGDDGNWFFEEHFMVFDKKEKRGVYFPRSELVEKTTARCVVDIKDDKEAGLEL